MPLGGDDQHVLLFDISPLDIGKSDWFHGGRHLEVWVRQSELQALAFANVWALIRTDA